MSDPLSRPVRAVAVLGGGTAGYFTALALQRAFPAMHVTLIESSTIPIIGVGEATTPAMLPFLHQQLGLDLEAFHRAVRPTWKLGIRFDWGAPAPYAFCYPFGPTNPNEAVAHDGDLGAQSLVAQLMHADRGLLLRTPEGTRSLLPWLKFAYHLDNEPLVGFLQRTARDRGVERIDAVIRGYDLAPDGETLRSVVLDDGRRLAFDLYVDATGFRAEVLGGALQTPFVRFDDTLFCDTAVVAALPHGGHIRPYTQAETMNAGWCWRIPVRHEDHRGYVFSSRFLSADAAEAEMRAKNPGMGEARLVRFVSGRRARFWRGNVVAVGNAYGFVEPLESTALHMVIAEVSYLLGTLEAAGDGPPDGALADARVGQHWDYLRWFLGLHYKFNARLQTPFWQACRADVDISGVRDLVEAYRAHGPWVRDDPRPAYDPRDPTFSLEGAMILLLGQRVPSPTPRARVAAAPWRARVEAQRALVAQALPVADCLAHLDERPALLRELLDHPASWCRTDGERYAGSLRVSPKADVLPASARLTDLDPLFRAV
ncbi:MAG: tryptophan halogenase family protein [Polyangiales bacterium]